MSPAIDEKLALDAFARQSLYWFVQLAFKILHPGEEYLESWHVEAICFQLQEMFEGRNRRLIINIHPRSLKSFIASVCFVAWALGRNPAAKFMCVSYGEALAKDLSLKTKRLMESPFYARLFPHTKISDVDDTALKFSTTAQGSRFATTMAGSSTGFGADFIVVDDPNKAGDAHSANALAEACRAFGGTLFTRLNKPKEGAIVVIMQRLHESDLTGTLLEQGGWNLLRIPAIAEQLEEYALYDSRTVARQPKDILQPAIFDEAELAERRKVMGSADFGAQYQQNPVPPGGGMLEWAWFGVYSELPPLEYVIQSYDTATTASAKADWSVCQTWGVCEKNYYLLAIDRFQCSHPELLRHAERLEAAHMPDAIICEDVGSGRAFYQEMRAKFGRRAFRDTPKISKVERALEVTAMLERGQVYLPCTAKWLSALRAEISPFPYGKHDDQVDAMVQFLRWAEVLVYKIKALGLSQQRRRKPPPGTPSSSTPVEAPRRFRGHSIYGLDRAVRDDFGRW